MSTATSEVLDLAADAIERRGWAFGGPKSLSGDPWGLNDPSSPVCLEGGILAALGHTVADYTAGTFHACPAYTAVLDYLWPERTPYARHKLFEWNDEDGRTAAEVIEVLRATAAIERVKEAVAEGAAAEPTQLSDKIKEMA